MFKVNNTDFIKTVTVSERDRNRRGGRGEQREKEVFYINYPVDSKKKKKEDASV